jgi:hypothetical protein
LKEQIVETSLKILSDIRIASPCPAKWDAMNGDERARHCGSCEKTVYNISTLTADEAAELIAAHEGKLCVRMFRRSDGTVITRDCPVGRAERIRKSIRAAIVSAASWLGLLSLAGCVNETTGSVDPARRAVPKSSDSAPTPMLGKVAKPEPIMGDIAVPAPPSIKDSGSGADRP